MNESLRVIRALQSRWAQKIACDHTRPYYADTVSSNLFLTRLNSDTEGELSRADGAELQDAGEKPAKMRALMSSSALAVNFFDSWRHAALPPLALALGLTGDPAALEFEHKCSGYPVGPRRPNLDLLLTTSDGTRIGVESKFAEPYRGSSGHKPLTPKYLRPDVSLWAQRGLMKAQQLAAAPQHDWLHLDAAQLLKHFLGLASEDEGPWSLLYLWYDTGLEDAATLRSEIEAFGQFVNEDGPVFAACSYQEAFARLETTSEPVDGWYGYMAERYFSTSTIPAPFQTHG